MPSEDSAPLDLVARYGTRRRTPWRTAGLVALAAVATAAVGFAGWRVGSPDVRADLLAYRVISDERVDITFEVRRPADRPVICVLRAQDANRQDVGYATVTISVGNPYLQPVFPLATRARAVVSELLGCAVDAAPRVAAPQFPPGTANPPQRSAIPGF